MAKVIQLAARRARCSHPSLLTSTPGSRQWISPRSVSTLHHVNKTVIPANASDEYLRQIFDDKDVWKLHSRGRSTTGIKSNGSYSTGLFENPNFVNAEGFGYAAQQAIEQAQTIVERICNAPENGLEEMRKVVKNLDRLSDTLCSVIDMAEFLRNAHPESDIMEAANQAYGTLYSYMNTLNTDTRIHQVLAQVLQDKSIVSQFSPDEHAAAIVFLRDFEKSGIHLPNAQRAKFVELSDQIIHLGREFIQREPRGITHVKVKLSSLGGMGVSAARKYLRKDGYCYIPTDSPECRMVLKYTDNEQVRKQVFEAANSANRESVLILEYLMRTRGELAKLVGKDSFAQLHLQDKMAKRPENVDTFLRTLLDHQAPMAAADIKLLQATKQRHLGLAQASQVNAWDRDYYMHLCSVSKKAMSQPPPPMPHLSIGSIMQGLSRLFQHMYGIQFEPATIGPGEVWHEDVRKLNVVCERQGKIGTIYCDLFSRPGKTTNAAHYTVRTSRRVDDDDAANDRRYAYPRGDGPPPRYAPQHDDAHPVAHRSGRFQLPVVALTCDFQRVRSQGDTALLSMFEVETLFHEVGHAMHSMLGQTDFHNVAGTRCATDFVELPSILMEQFVWHPQVLQLFAKDSRTGKSLSPEAVNAHLQQRQWFSSIETNSQILMALLDQQYHSAEALSPSFSSVSIWHNLQDQVGLFPSAPGTMWPVQFGHLFGYGAGYYSYLFDRTLARRVWDKCFKHNPLDRQQGQALRDNLLKWGGARDPWTCVAELLGGVDGDRIALGDETAMRTMGDWNIVL